MTERNVLLESIADIVADYREGDISRRDANTIDRWVSQFPDDIQEPILDEMCQVLKKTYISQKDILKFLKGVTSTKKLCGNDPKSFWKKACFLNIQRGGNSQVELLAMFNEVLKQKHGLEIANCGSDGGPYIYLDDGVFSGGSVLRDLSEWIKDEAPSRSEVHVIVAIIHEYGQYYASRKLNELATSVRKEVRLKWWRIHALENRYLYKDESDVLWPTIIPDSPLADKYVRYITEEKPKYNIILRTAGSIGKKKFFSSDTARTLLEKAFLEAGLEVREKCPYLNEYMRPLGATPLKTFGFGSVIVTFRNCPNCCPLSWWADSPWFPLFPRSTNTDALIDNMVKKLRIEGC